MQSPERSTAKTQTAKSTDAIILRRSEIDPGTDYTPPNGKLETQLANIWGEILRIDKVGTLDNFFELGGDSLQAFELFFYLEREFGVLFSPSIVIEHPTITQQATFISAHTKNRVRRKTIAKLPDSVLNRYLILREKRPNYEYQLSATPQRKLFPQGGLQEVYTVSTDSEGFIKPAFHHKRADVNIVFLGASTTECLLVAPQNRFPYAAARKLEELLGLKVNGINAAHSMNNSMHSLLLLLGKIIPLRPDFIVLMQVGSDIGALMSHGNYWITEGLLRIFEIEKLSTSAALVRFLTSLVPNNFTQTVLRAFRVIRDLLRSFRGRKSDGLHRISFFRSEAVPTELTEKSNWLDPRKRQIVAAHQFENALTSFVRIAVAWDIVPVLMTEVIVQQDSRGDDGHMCINCEQPKGVAQRPEEFATIHDHFNAIVREVALSEGIPLIDLAAAQNWALGDVYDGVHFTDRGSQKVAEIVAAALKDQIVARMKKPI